MHDLPLIITLPRVIHSTSWADLVEALAPVRVLYTPVRSQTTTCHLISDSTPFAKAWG